MRRRDDDEVIDMTVGINILLLMYTSIQCSNGNNYYSTLQSMITMLIRDLHESTNHSYVCLSIRTSYNTVLVHGYMHVKC